ncbi:MAG TPA: amidohydrolase [Terriglobales bacterium]|nr:amidohydrolase [Terriglobales bacterium]
MKQLSSANPEAKPLITSIICLLITLFLLARVAAAETQTPADVIVIHARIYTVNAKQPWAEALAVRGGRITAVGTDTQIQALCGPHTRTLDVQGHLVLPGFTDSHVHFLDGSLSLLQVNLDGLTTIPEIQEAVKAYAAAHPDAPWILGRGWSYPVFAPSGLPDRKYLDQVIPNRPVYLEGFDGHTWWANSMALRLAGINRDTPNPPNGTIVRDSAGDATGAIQEDAADAVVRRAIPAPAREEKVRAFRAGMLEANRVGVVRIHSVGGVSMGNPDLGNVDLLEQLRGSGELTVRLYLAYRVDPPEITGRQLEQIEEAKKRYHDEWISAGAVKFFLDGVVESHTAAMLEPYSDDPSQVGKLFWDPEIYKKEVRELDRRGLQIFTHAIGTKAVRMALDAYQQAAETNHTGDARHRIEHVETISAADVPRFGKLGVIASMQPLHSYPDDDTLKIWARNAGPDRASRAWAWHSIHEHGGILSFGSDWPIVTLRPWPGVQTAVTRQTSDGKPPDGFVPQERLSLEDTIKAYTLGAAIAGRREKTEGSLEPGKLADLIVLSQDLFKIPPREIDKTEVMLTMVGGKVVYESPAWKTVSTTAGK